MTTPSASYCRFTEGSIVLPDGYQDRTMNAFTPSQDGEPAFTVSRDRLNDGETVGAYIDRQLVLMTQHFKGWKTQARDAIWLGDRVLEGERLQASYLRDGQRLWQQQAVFAFANAQILVFTLSKTTTPSAVDESRFNALLGSFTFNP